MARPAGNGLSAEKLRDLARVGAGHAIERLRAEIIAIERTFPELKLPTRRTVVRAATQVTKRTRRMSAAARKAVSARMKRYCTKPLRGSYFTHQLLVAA